MEHCAHEGGVIQVGEKQFTDFMQKGKTLCQEYCCYCGNTRWRGEAIRPTKKHGPFLRVPRERAYAIVETAEWNQPCPERKEPQ